MNSDNRRIAALLRDAADKVEEFADDQWAHTVTITVDGQGVVATIEWDHNSVDMIETGEPVVLR